jgi:hypothetical protein
MAIESLPNFFGMDATDKGEKLSKNFHLYLDQQSQTLNNLVGFFQHGVQFPIKTNDEITDYSNDTSVPVGTVWYSSNDSKLKLKVGAGSIEEIQSM